MPSASILHGSTESDLLAVDHHRPSEIRLHLRAEEIMQPHRGKVMLRIALCGSRQGDQDLPAKIAAAKFSSARCTGCAAGIITDLERGRRLLRPDVRSQRYQPLVGEQRSSGHSCFGSSWFLVAYQFLDAFPNNGSNDVIRVRGFGAASDNVSSLVL